MTTVGEVVAAQLERAGVEVVFGVPGVHTLEYYRGFAASGLRCVLARHEGGAAFMADGYARATGRPAVCCVISGPGITNAATGVAQARADSIPLLLLASAPASASLGRGHGMLHELPRQLAVLEQISGAAWHAGSPAALAELVPRALASLASGRRRPLAIEAPTDVLDAWTDVPDAPSAARAVAAPSSAAAAGEPVPSVAAPPAPDAAALDRVLALVRAARSPCLLVGGGCVDAAPAIRTLAARLGFPVLTTVAGKGVVADGDPLLAGALLPRPEAQAWLAERDLLLVFGSELSETDTDVERLTLPPHIVRVDVDATRFADAYPAELAVLADAGTFATALAARLADDAATRPYASGADEARALREAVVRGSGEQDRALGAVLAAIRAGLPAHARVYSDMTQLAYAGNVAFPVAEPRRWLHPSGYGTLGYALPAAIGGAVGDPAAATVALAGDGGLLYTVQELATATELEIPLTVVLWDNDALGQIRDDMVARGIPPTSVLPRNPDFAGLARAFGFGVAEPASLDELSAALADATAARGRTLVRLRASRLR